MTGQDLLDRMELLNQEFQLQAGEADTTRGLLAINVAIDYFEGLAAAKKGILGGSTGQLTTSASTETTTFPSGVLRIDRLHLLTGNAGSPKRELTRVHRTGGHVMNSFWPHNLLESTSTGEPRGYWTNGTNIYWAPLPDGTYYIRYYGFSSHATMVAATTFAYPDIVALPIAAMAVKLLKTGIDDDTESLDSIAAITFKPVLDTLSNFNRDGAKPFEYTQVHNT